MNSTLYLDHIPESPVGPIALAATALGVLRVEIGPPTLDDWILLLREPLGDRRAGPFPFPAARQLSEYFAGKRKTFDLPLDWSALRPFQRSVLELVAAIPYGETRTYAEIAVRIGRPLAYRAVGRANATNPLPILIPCHRLVGADGSLRGYGAPGGVQTKAWLLELERNAAV